MTEDQFMQAVLARNPGLDKPDEEVVKLKARGLKALLRQAFQKGYEDASEKLAKVCAASTGAGAAKHSGPSSVPPGFESLFNGSWWDK